MRHGESFEATIAIGLRSQTFGSCGGGGMPAALGKTAAGRILFPPAGCRSGNIFGRPMPDAGDFRE
jgi:hypothetical protein